MPEMTSHVSHAHELTTSREADAGLVADLLNTIPATIPAAAPAPSTNGPRPTIVDTKFRQCADRCHVHAVYVSMALTGNTAAEEAVQKVSKLARRARHAVLRG